MQLISFLVWPRKDSTSLWVAITAAVAQSDGGSKSPEAGNAYNDGLDQARKGNFKAAEPLFKTAIKADAQFAQAFYMLGYTQKRLSQQWPT